MTVRNVTCTACKGEGTVDREIGGDGYGDRCCATADVPTKCGDCHGTGVEETRHNGLSIWPVEDGFYVTDPDGADLHHTFDTVAGAVGFINDLGKPNDGPSYYDREPSEEELWVERGWKHYHREG